MADYMNRFGEWQNYAHYLLLTIWLFIAHWLSGIWGIERLAVNHWWGMIALFSFYFASFVIGDSIIHGIFWILPKPLRWRD
jgi:hypothetical protein